MQTEQTKTAVIRRYDSVTEALELSRTPSKANKELWQEFETRPPRGGEYGTAWYGVEGAQTKVRELIALGWTEGAEKLEKNRAEVTANNAPAPINIRRRRSWADNGDTLDITRTYAGNMEAWQKCIKTAANSTRYIEVIVNLAITFGKPASEIFYKGTAALIFADLMTAAGYNVKISACAAVKRLFNGDSNDSLDIITVKDYQAPLDIESLASVVCLAGFFRLAWFQLATTHEQSITDYLGSAKSYTAIQDLEPHQISNLEDVTNVHTARDWIERAIKKVQDNAEREAA